MDQMAPKLDNAGSERPFGQQEWVSTRELVKKYGRTVDFWQKLAGKGAFEAKRNGLGPRAHLSINVKSFEAYWNSLKNGAAPCPPKMKISDSSNVAAYGTRGKGGRAKNGKHPLIQRIRRLANKEASAG